MNVDWVNKDNISKKYVETVSTYRPEVPKVCSLSSASWPPKCITLLTFLQIITTIIMDIHINHLNWYWYKLDFLSLLLVSPAYYIFHFLVLIFVCILNKWCCLLQKETAGWIYIYIYACRKKKSCQYQCHKLSQREKKKKKKKHQKETKTTGGTRLSTGREVEGWIPTGPSI